MCEYEALSWVVRFGSLKSQEEAIHALRLTHLCSDGQSPTPVFLHPLNGYLAAA